MRSGCERDRRLLHPRIHWEFQDCLQDNNYCRKRDSELTIDRDERKKKGARIDIEDVKKILKENITVVTGAGDATEHSLRRAGAQDYAWRRVPLWMIQFIGRWGGQTVMKYLEWAGFLWIE